MRVDGLDDLRHPGEVADDRLAHVDVQALRALLIIGEGRRFAEDPGSQADLADVVQHGGQFESLEGLLGQSQRFSELQSVHGHPVGVPAGVVVPRAHDVHQPPGYAAESVGSERRPCPWWRPR